MMTRVLKCRSQHPETGSPRWRIRQDAGRAVLAFWSAEPDHLRDHPAAEVLGGVEGALGYLYGTWATHFGVAMDDELDRTLDVGEAAWRAWRRVAVEHPRLVDLLWWQREEPVVRAAEVRHRLRLSQMTGRPTTELPGFEAAPSDEGASVGAPGSSNPPLQ